MITTSIKSLSYFVGESQNGKSLFAATDISKGTVLFGISGNYLNFKQAVLLGKHESYCLQTDLNTYLVPHYPFFLSNHSCIPNCGINDKLQFIAIDNIEKESELVWDYSTSMLERRWTMRCNCGSSKCRELINDFDQIPLPIQQKYLMLDIVMPYITRFLEIRANIDASMIAEMHNKT